ncbi:MAG: GNAT family N-acetyltransferase [Candidatus Pristimantibacillus lignocellulolyticus]|uniref:GNAT family N-acetyltransferase n=1 Tax=Candidatus Pristimantibacillus lignocellulolyticus TaxID=2994561 RepID=A0A9J6ZCF3_9BACL|nr:MAG: GNAT family N-acetyltransferase [Candidatus Pristimantibacillus lignocellulolyticus]
MKCRLDFYNSKWESIVRSFELNEKQKDFVFVPSKALDFFELDNNCFAIIIFLETEPIGFFILHRSKEAKDYSDKIQNVFLRSLSIDRNYQCRGYAGSAMRVLPKFICDNFPETEEIILTVHEKNTPAKKLYEKSGFVYNGKNIKGRKGNELVMIYSLLS